VLGEEEVVVLDVKLVDLHGVIYRDVTVTFADRSIGQARLGPEGVPTDLEPGDVVLATKVVNMIVSLRRP
jgi:hypothetical protein